MAAIVERQRRRRLLRRGGRPRSETGLSSVRARLAVFRPFLRTSTSAIGELATPVSLWAREQNFPLQVPLTPTGEARQAVRGRAAPPPAPRAASDGAARAPGRRARWRRW